MFTCFLVPRHGSRNPNLGIFSIANTLIMANRLVCVCAMITRAPLHVLVCCLEISAERPDGYDESCFLRVTSETVFSSHSVQAVPLQYLKGLLKLSAGTGFKISLSTETDRPESFGLEKGALWI